MGGPWRKNGARSRARTGIQDDPTMEDQQNVVEASFPAPCVYRLSRTLVLSAGCARRLEVPPQFVDVPRARVIPSGRVLSWGFRNWMGRGAISSVGRGQRPSPTLSRRRGPTHRGPARASASSWFVAAGILLSLATLGVAFGVRASSSHVIRSAAQMRVGAMVSITGPNAYGVVGLPPGRGLLENPLLTRQRVMADLVRRSPGVTGVTGVAVDNVYDARNNLTADLELRIPLDGEGAFEGDAAAARAALLRRLTGTLSVHRRLRAQEARAWAEAGVYADMVRSFVGPTPSGSVSDSETSAFYEALASFETRIAEARRTLRRSTSRTRVRQSMGLGLVDETEHPFGVLLMALVLIGAVLSGTAALARFVQRAPIRRRFEMEPVGVRVVAWVRTRGLLVLLGAALGASVGLALSLRAPPRYEASLWLHAQNPALVRDEGITSEKIAAMLEADFSDVGALDPSWLRFDVPTSPVPPLRMIERLKRVDVSVVHLLGRHPLRLPSDVMEVTASGPDPDAIFDALTLAEMRFMSICEDIREDFVPWMDDVWTLASWRIQAPPWPESTRDAWLPDVWDAQLEQLEIRTIAASEDTLGGSVLRKTPRERLTVRTWRVDWCVAGALVGLGFAALLGLFLSQARGHSR